MLSKRTTVPALGLVATLALAALPACTGVISDVGGSQGGPSTTGGATGSSSGTGSSGTGTSGSSGTGTSTGAGTGTGTTTGTGGPSFACQAGTVEPGPTTMQVLTHDQYVNTVRDLVGDVPQLATALGANSGPLPFGLVPPALAQVDLEGFSKAAELVGAAVVADAAKLNTLAPCAATADKRTCARTFVQSFVSRAYRAPLVDAADIDRHLALYDVGATTSYAHGIELILRAVLQAPRFLYRVELGTPEAVGPNAVKLSGYEVAARLSYAVWNSAPDTKLTAAAAAGTLSTKEGVAAQLGGMLTDPKGAQFVRRFLEGWISLSEVDVAPKDPKLFPDWGTATIRTAARNQASAFFDYILQSQQGSFASLLTSRTVFVNSALGAYYGVAGTSAFQPLDRPEGTVSGMLTLPALLATLAKPGESSPIYRGKFVRERLFCQELPAPPPDVPNPPDVPAGVSTREKFRQHSVNPLCAGCHTLMDPIGFGFENFDAVGRYRTTDNGAMVDVSGEIFESADANGKFVGVTELGKKLASSAEVEQCLARQWFRFVLSRFEQNVDGCSMKTIVDQFKTANGSLNALPAAIVQTDAFVYRRPIN